MFQSITVIGHLGADPEMRYTPTGVPVTSFNIATSEKFQNAAGQAVEKTTWHRITCWRKLAETTATYLQKGRLVMVRGRVEASAWTDKEGVARASLEVTADTVKFLGASNGNGNGNGHAAAAVEMSADEVLEELAAML